MINPIKVKRYYTKAVAELKERSLLNDEERNKRWSEFTDLFLTLQLNPRMKRVESESLLLKMEKMWADFSYTDRQDIKKNIALQSPEHARFLNSLERKEK